MLGKLLANLREYAGEFRSPGRPSGSEFWLERRKLRDTISGSYWRQGVVVVRQPAATRRIIAVNGGQRRLFRLPFPEALFAIHYRYGLCGLPEKFRNGNGYYLYHFNAAFRPGAGVREDLVNIPCLNDNLYGVCMGPSFNALHATIDGMINDSIRHYWDSIFAVKGWSQLENWKAAGVPLHQVTNARCFLENGGIDRWSQNLGRRYLTSRKPVV